MLCGLRFQIDFTQTSFDEAYQRLYTNTQRYRTQSIEYTHHQALLPKKNMYVPVNLVFYL